MVHSLFVRLLLAGITALALCSCGGGGRSLTIAINAGVEGSALRASAEEWGAAQEVRVEVVELPYGSLFEKELMDLSSRTGAYDVIMMDDPWFPRMAEGGKLRQFPFAPGGDFLTSCVDVCRYPYKTGQLYALPYVGNSQLFFYRKDLFDRYRLPAPQTWPQVLHAAKVIGTGEKIHGYVMRAAPGNAAVTDFMPLLWAFGADIFTEGGKPSLARKEGVEALRFMLELGKYSPPGYAGFNADEVSAHLLQATAAMSINWPAWISAMDDPNKSRVVGKIEYAQMPAAKAPGQAELGSWLLGVPAASKHPQLAFDFIKWATDTPQMKRAAERGNPPTRRSVFEDPELKQKFRSYPAQLQSLESARPRPRTARWNEVENALGIFLSQANSGALSAEQAMKGAEKEITAIIEREQ